MPLLPCIAPVVQLNITSIISVYVNEYVLYIYIIFPSVFTIKILIMKYPSNFLVIPDDGHCVAIRKVAGSIPDGVIGLLH